MSHSVRFTTPGPGCCGRCVDTRCSDISYRSITNDNIVAFEQGNRFDAATLSTDYYYCNFDCRLFTYLDIPITFLLEKFLYVAFLAFPWRKTFSINFPNSPSLSFSFQAKVSKLRYDSEIDVDKISSGDYHRSCDSQDS